MYDKPRSIRIPAELWRKVRHEAADRDVSATVVVIEALQQRYETKET